MLVLLLIVIPVSAQVEPLVMDGKIKYNGYENNKSELSGEIKKSNFSYTVSIDVETLNENIYTLSMTYQYQIKLAQIIKDDVVNNYNRYSIQYMQLTGYDDIVLSEQETLEFTIITEIYSDTGLVRHSYFEDQTDAVQVRVTAWVDDLDRFQYRYDRLVDSVYTHTVGNPLPQSIRIIQAVSEDWSVGDDIDDFGEITGEIEINGRDCWQIYNSPENRSSIINAHETYNSRMVDKTTGTVHFYERFGPQVAEGYTHSGSTLVSGEDLLKTREVMFVFDIWMGVIVIFVALVNKRIILSRIRKTNK